MERMTIFYISLAVVVVALSLGLGLGLGLKKSDDDKRSENDKNDKNNFDLKNMNIRIYYKKEELTEGIFGQALMWILNDCLILNKNNIQSNRILFDVDTTAYGKLFTNIIQIKNIHEEKEIINYKPFYETIIKNLNLKYKLDKGLVPKDETFENFNKIFNLHFKFSDFFLSKIPNNFSDVMSSLEPILGIHYRGTDKNKDRGQANAITQNEFLIILKDFLDNSNVNFKNIFVCSDEKGFVEKILESYPNINILQYKQDRAEEGTEEGFFRDCSNIKKQQDMKLAAIMDCYLLSKCHSILKCSSALSSFSKILNPKLKAYQVSAMKIKWFPAGYIPGYIGHSEDSKKILNRTLKGHVGNYSNYIE